MSTLHPYTAGLAAVDYRFTDDVADPSDTHQTFTEELVRLGGPGRVDRDNSISGDGGDA